MGNRIGFKKLDLNDMKDLPDQNWAKSIVAGVNYLALNYYNITTGNSIDLQSFSNIQVKQIQLNVTNPWIDAIPQGDWYGKGCQVKLAKLYDGSVQMRGFILGGTYGTPAFILPQDMRPSSSYQIPCVSNSVFNTLGINTNGQVIPGGTGTGLTFIQHRFMPSNNRNQPLPCFPVNVKTRFKASPVGVVAIRNSKTQKLAQKPINAPVTPSWRFVNIDGQPTVQILDIQGLEHDCKQKVTILILGGSE